MSQTCPSILAVSSVNMDLVLQTDRVPVAGETYIGNDYRYVPGGKGANQAVAAARLGADVTFVGKVGKDNHGSYLKARLEEEGVCTDFLKVDPTVQTGLAIILLEETGENRIIVYPSANMKIEESQVQRAFERDYDAVVLNLETTDAIVIEVVRQAKLREIPVVLDAGPARPFPLSQIEGLHVLSPNETETQALTGLECHTPAQAEGAAERLAEMSKAQFIVVKLGDQGALLWHEGESELFPAHQVLPVDTTAAGDAFTGALTAEYLRTGNLRRAIAYANVAGALTVTQLGAQPSLPTAERMAEFMSERELCLPD